MTYSCHSDISSVTHTLSVLNVSRALDSQHVCFALYSIGVQGMGLQEPQLIVCLCASKCLQEQNV